jgi:dihydrolipoamide dehydrogenase
MAQAFDVVVIGGGPGGYVAAIRAAQLGLSTACIESRGALGGTCLNVGCIPSKAMLHSSELFEEAKHHGAEHGIIAKDVKLDLKAMLARKDKVVKDLTGGIEFLFKKNKVTYLKGHGTIKGKNEVEVNGETITAKNIIIATGSVVTPLPGVDIDEKQVVSSTGALALGEVPDHLVVIGAGVIGLEMGSVWRRLGAKVTVVEYLDRIAPSMDGEMGKQFNRILEKQGFAFKLGTKVTGAKKDKKTVTLTLEPAAGGKAETLIASHVLVAIGRKPNTEKLGLENAGLKTDEKGRIPVDKHLRTAVPNIYAIGDVVPGPMLAHKAEEDGVAAAEIIAGQAGHVDWDMIPSVIYTAPEAAWIGKTEEQLKAEGREYKVGKFPMTANSRARAVGKTEGLVKILADAKYDRVLGVHIVGYQAGTMLAEAFTAMTYGASAEDIARTCHSHPDMNEAVKEAAMAVAGRAIHI